MSAPLEILVDGQPCAQGWPMDRGLLYGDGLFETMLVRGGRIRFESDHRARLAEGCRRLDIRVDLARVWQDTLQAAARHREASLRLQVTRGQALARGYAPGAGEVPSTFLAVFPPPSPRELPSPIRLVTLQLRLGENPLLAGLKHCNRLEQVLARRELAGTVGACEGLLGSSSGLLISGTMSNVFLQLDGELVTPALTRCGVAGVLRTALLREAEHAGTPVRVADIDLAALSRCTSAAISNARLGLLPAHELDGRQLEGCERINALAARIAAA